VTEIAVEFPATIQSIGALKEAAYRLVGQASCQIDEVGGRYVCRLTPVKAGGDDVKARFLDLVTDENLREKLAVEAGPMRNVIVALAFGSLASADE
jgi:His-Xaa-Ser system protein HxsD